ncbi:Holliday junction branch migration protein RuvA [Salirhabdus salicampi]|uniref:Holliday junction branch migration protein RuvA n=1 Tax=Salirhabdus salicampi TaxID=476102 RepID=UPI0020C23D2C|nr:Holliday junction branch migration protein RuvA [Salirhabdus salicampi]MCP8616992.1 Holliday junction branch migration protein RuvA [Salirhabdus salicampi]
MIAFIEGTLDTIEDEKVVVVTNGVGYEIVCANPYDFQRNMNEQIRIYTYHYVREDAQVLYGFKAKEEKWLFAKLLNVSGIGPKGALNIIGTSGTTEIAAAIEREDEKYLTRFPGVGKKTARQMILDLKGKVTEWVDIPSNSLFSDEIPADPTVLDEGIEALKALGYSEREIQSIVPMLRKEEITSVDECIKKALALLIKSS